MQHYNNKKRMNTIGTKQASKKTFQKQEIKL